MYCLKCRKKVEISKPRLIKMKEGSPPDAAYCPKCKTKVFRIGK